MDFVAVDVETANPDMASICQIGIAVYVKGDLCSEWVSKIDPEDYFHQANVQVHGITKAAVQGAPKLPDVVPHIAELLEGRTCVSHTHFDRISITRAFEKYRLRQMSTVWLDSAMVARRTWAECAQKGYGLSSLCSKIGYEFQAHDALEDAKACGAVFVAALNKSGLTVEDWLQRVKQPVNEWSSRGHSVRRDGNPNGPLYGSKIVFTGSLSIMREEAAEMAASLGCQVMDSVSRKTDFLVIGNQDLRYLAGKSKTTKLLRAEQIIFEGGNLRIIEEADFIALMNSCRQA